VKHLEQFKERCVACGSRTNPKNKEHPFPQWLITRTKTDRTSIRWIPGNRIPADQATLPLCRQCNGDFGDQLEAPMSRILDDIEAGRGLSDNEAELIVRWLWKIEGLLWHLSHPTHDYSPKYTLRERVLRPLDAIRGELIVALALCASVDPTYGDAPMGLDSHGDIDGIFVSGVFSRTAMMIVLAPFQELIPQQFSQYRLAPIRGQADADAKLLYPKTTFPTDTELVGVTWLCSRQLTAAHEAYAHQLHANGLTKRCSEPRDSVRSAS
jgi:hypothetical protein